VFNVHRRAGLQLVWVVANAGRVPVHAQLERRHEYNAAHNVRRYELLCNVAD
jgi:hypothetical protein